MPLSPSPETRRKYLHGLGGQSGAAADPGDRGRHRPRIPDGVDLKGRLSAVGRVRDRKRDPARKPDTDLYAEELAQSEAELEAAEARLRELIAELVDPGRRAQGPRRPLRLFPARWAAVRSASAGRSASPRSLTGTRSRRFRRPAAVAELLDESALSN